MDHWFYVGVNIILEIWILDPLQNDLGIAETIIIVDRRQGYLPSNFMVL